jgi:hypothetical protein
LGNVAEKHFLCQKDSARIPDFLQGKPDMPALILDGKQVAQRSESELSERVSAMKAKSDGRTPVLATILVGDDPASATYVKMKGNACPQGWHGIARH